MSQCVICISKAPIDGAMFLIENHLNIRKCNRQCFERRIISYVFLRRIRCSAAVKSGNHLPAPRSANLLKCLSAAAGTSKRFSVQQFDTLFIHPVNGIFRYNAASAYTKKTVSKLLFKPLNRGVCLTCSAAGKMNDCFSPL